MSTDTSSPPPPRQQPTLASRYWSPRPSRTTPQYSIAHFRLKVPRLHASSISKNSSIMCKECTRFSRSFLKSCCTYLAPPGIWASAPNGAKAGQISAKPRGTAPPQSPPMRVTPTVPLVVVGVERAVVWPCHLPHLVSLCLSHRLPQCVLSFSISWPSVDAAAVPTKMVRSR